MTTDRPGWAGSRTVGLLDAVLRDSMEPAYAARAADPARTAARGGVGRGATVLVLALVAVGVVCLRQGTDVPQTTASRTALVDDITRSDATVSELRRQVAALTAQDDAATDAALSRDSAGATLQARVDALAAQAAESPVTGRGLVVTLTDTVPRTPDGQTATTAQVERGRVTDRDLQQLVNTLFASGATAIDVGGIRLTATTPVRSAGETVLVGLQPLASPYEVRVVGPPAGLRTAVDVSAVGRRLVAAAQLGGPVLDERAAQVTVAAAATVSLRFAAPAG